ncbi:MAG TPA: hypothetical protein VF519_13495 [Mycobacteriales bacterium]|jgi:plastocyanin
MNGRARGTAIALCALAVPAAPARALPAPVPHQVVTVAARFVVSEVTVFRGDTLTLTNADPTLSHDLVSRNFAGGLRIFGSPPAGPGERVEVARVATLAPGVYPFYCSLHESMIGNLRVQTAPAR